MPVSETQVINLIDRCGGVANAFDKGLRPCHASGALKPILDDAYDAYLVLKSRESVFYQYAENCGFEE